MTDNEIVKALKICTSEHLGCEDDCPYATKKLTYSQCKLELSKDIIDLINRQKAENERLKEESDMADGYEGALVEMTKSEAIKEFAEKFKKKAGSIVTSCQGYEIYETKQYQISAVDFDNLVKEMVGK